MANIAYNERDGFILDPSRRVIYEQIICVMCKQRFRFAITQELIEVAKYNIPRPEYCDECVDRMKKFMQERDMCVPKGGIPEDQYGGGIMGNPFANVLGGVASMMGAIGGEAAATLTTTTYNNLANVYAQQMQNFQQAAAANGMNALAQQLLEQAAKVPVPKLEEIKPKEAPKIELNPKRAVQLEE